MYFQLILRILIQVAVPCVPMPPNSRFELGVFFLPCMQHLLLSTAWAVLQIDLLVLESSTTRMGEPACEKQPG